jgi:hypothetical protein
MRLLILFFITPALLFFSCTGREETKETIPEADSPVHGLPLIGGDSLIFGMLFLLDQNDTLHTNDSIIFRIDSSVFRLPYQFKADKSWIRLPGGTHTATVMLKVGGKTYNDTIELTPEKNRKVLVISFRKPGSYQAWLRQRALAEIEEELTKDNAVIADSILEARVALLRRQFPDSTHAIPKERYYCFIPPAARFNILHLFHNLALNQTSHR